MENHFSHKATFLITGGTGFVGKSILDHLNQYSKGTRIVVHSRGRIGFEASKWPNLNLKILVGEVADLKVEEKLDYIIHAATSTNPEESQTVEYLEKTVIEGTKNILSIASQKKIKGLLYVSSGAVYGLSGHSSALSETSESVVKDDSGENYGIYKRRGEKLCREFFDSTKIPTCIARCFAFSGQNLDSRAPFALISFLKAALSGDKIVIKSSGLAVRSYMDEQDLSHWLLTLVEKNQDFDVVNVGSDKPISIKELALQIQEMTGVGEPEILHQDHERQNFYVPVIGHAKEKYGLAQKISLKESLARMIQSKKFG